MLTTLILGLSLLSPLTPDEPFTELKLPAARALAKSEGKLVVIDFTAEWCKPCKQMDAETWADPRVKSWLSKHAVAVKVDVDEEPKVAREFEVQAMPTVVILRDDVLFDRKVGYQDAKRFLQWGKQVVGGKRNADALLERSAELRESEGLSERHGLAKSLVEARLLDQALEHYLWLWTASRDKPSWGGVRHSYLIQEIADLVRQHRPARKAFFKLLNQQQELVEASVPPSIRDWMEWSSMCQAFGQGDRKIRWYERSRDGDGRLFATPFDSAAARSSGEFILQDIFSSLIELQRPLDALRLFPEPLEHTRQLLGQHGARMESYAGMEEELRARAELRAQRGLTTRLGQLYGALLQVQRFDQASSLAELLLVELDLPMSRIALVTWGLKLTKDPRAEFTRWLDEAEAAGGKVGKLRRKFERLARKQAEAK